MRRLDFAFVIIAALLWGSGGVLGKVLIEDESLAPLTVACLRMLVGGAALTAWVALRGVVPWRGLSGEAWRRVLVTGALTAAFEATFFTAISFSSVGFATLIAIGATPVLVALYEWLTTRHAPRPLVMVGMALSITGLLLLTSGKVEGARSLGTGALFALVTAASFAGIILANRRPVASLSAERLTGLAFLAGGVMLLPLSLFAGFGVPQTARGWGVLVLMAVVVTAVAYVFYLKGLRTVTATVAATVTLIEPLVAAVLGWIVFSESLGVLGIFGGALMGTAVVLLSPRSPEPAH